MATVLGKIELVKCHFCDEVAHPSQMRYPDPRATEGRYEPACPKTVRTLDGYGVKFFTLQGFEELRDLFLHARIAEVLTPEPPKRRKGRLTRAQIRVRNGGAKRTRTESKPAKNGKKKNVRGKRALPAGRQARAS